MSTLRSIRTHMVHISADTIQPDCTTAKRPISDSRQYVPQPVVKLRRTTPVSGDQFPRRPARADHSRPGRAGGPVTGLRRLLPIRLHVQRPPQDRDWIRQLYKAARIFAQTRFLCQRPTWLVRIL